MKKDIELAMHHAADLARARGGTLASVTLRGTGVASVVIETATVALGQLGVPCREIRFEAGKGPVRLACVELDR